MSLKEQIHQHCLQLAQQQVDSLLAIQAELKDALGSESKSTAGDKHETGRAMIQLEQERAGTQLQQAEHLLSVLQSFNPQQTGATVQAGSLVATSRGRFYISVGLGKLDLNGEQYFAISPTAPLAQVLLGKKVGDKALFNGQELEVMGVE